MDIVLGVSLTPKTVRLVLVEGVQGDGAIVDHDTFDVTPSDRSATSSASSQVVAAVLGTLESAREGGHQLKAIGVTWSDHSEASELRDALAAAGVDDAILVSELHAAGALAQTAGRAVGYESTGLLFLDRDTATLSVVRTDDGSIVKVLSRSLHSTDAMAVLTEMASAVAAQDSPPQGMFVVGSGVDVASVKSHLQDLVSIPVNAPEESGLALARGAALAAASAPIFDASTVGLAYSQDPDGATAGNDHPGLSGADTQLRAVATVAPLADEMGFDEDFGDMPAEEGRKPFLLVGSALTSVFVIGVIALVISLAVSIRPTADQRPDPGQSAIIPSAAAPAAPLPEIAQPPAPAPAPAAPAPPPAETIKAPIPVVQQEQAPRRQVYVAPEAPAPQAPPAPLPDPPTAPVPDPVPVVAPPVPAVIPPLLPRIFSPPVQQYPRYPQYGQYPQQYPQDPPQQQYPQYPPQRQYPQQQYPQQQYPQKQYPQQQYPQQQQPQNPWQPPSNQGPSGDDDGWPGSGSGGGSGRGGSGGGSGGGGGGSNCFLIFCAPAGGGRN
ncbi:MAG TPA: hypothetical protein VET27_16840 [Mycobacterium sp.]|nr:hypothetical protein [Mycobacterium sp.]